MLSHLTFLLLKIFVASQYIAIPMTIDEDLWNYHIFLNEEALAGIALPGVYEFWANPSDRFNTGGLIFASTRAHYTGLEFTIETDRKELDEPKWYDTLQEVVRPNGKTLMIAEKTKGFSAIKHEGGDLQAECLLVDDLGSSFFVLLTLDGFQQKLPVDQVCNSLFSLR